MEGECLGNMMTMMMLMVMVIMMLMMITVQPNGQLMEGGVFGEHDDDDDADDDADYDADDDDDDGPSERAINGGGKMFGEEGKTL